MHPKPPRVSLTHPHRYCAARLGPRILAFASQPGEHAVGLVMIELVGQRRQRPAARSPEHDLAHKVIGQLLRQHGAWHSQDIRRRLPCAGQPGVIQHSQLSRYSRLQPFQQRRRSSRQRCIWH